MLLKEKSKLKPYCIPEISLSIAFMHMPRRVVLASEAPDVVHLETCISIMDIGAVSTLPIQMESRKIFLMSLKGPLKLHSTSKKIVKGAIVTFGILCIGKPRPSFKKEAIDNLLHVCKYRTEYEILFIAADSPVPFVSGFDVQFHCFGTRR